MSQWQNYKTFSTDPNNPNNAVLLVNVDYCVYAPGQFSLSFPAWDDPTDGTQYVYAYQIFNDVDRSYPSKAPVVRFSVGLNGPFEEEANNIGYIIDDPNHTVLHQYCPQQEYRPLEFRRSE